MGARSAGSEKATEWAAGAGNGASEGSFADAAAHGEVLFNCTAGTALSTTSLAVVYAVLVETRLNTTSVGKLLMSACFVTDLGHSA